MHVQEGRDVEQRHELDVRCLFRFDVWLEKISKLLVVVSGISVETAVGFAWCLRGIYVRLFVISVCWQLLLMWGSLWRWGLVVIGGVSVCWNRNGDGHVSWWTSRNLESRETIGEEEHKRNGKTVGDKGKNYGKPGYVNDKVVFVPEKNLNWCCFKCLQFKLLD